MQLEEKDLLYMLEQYAISLPNKNACVFLKDSETEVGKLTYSELYKQARTVGGYLQRHGFNGERILLPFSPGLNFIVSFIGCLYAGAIAVPVPSPTKSTLERTLSSLETIVKDADIAMVLCDTDFIEFYERNGKLFNFLSPVPIINFKEISDKYEKEYCSFLKISPSTIAYLQYTSGSTSSPKGVICTQENMTRNFKVTATALGYEEDSIALNWAPHTHAYGLLYGYLLPLYCGATCFLMAPTTFLSHPMQWLLCMSKYRATHSGCPSFGYDLCVNYMDEEQIQGIDLNNWRVAVTGSEIIRAKTIMNFYEKYKLYNFNFEAFTPLYGMSETVGTISTSNIGKEPVLLNLDTNSLKENTIKEDPERKGRVIVGCGKVVPGLDVVIMDPHSGKETKNIGEIWVSGYQCSPGYWNTADKKHLSTDFSRKESQRKYLKTGDLGFLRDGEIFITGRLKEIIILFGKNHYPTDIETTISNSHPILKNHTNAAFSVELDDREELIIVQEVIASLDTNQLIEIIRAMRKALSKEHGLDAYEVVLVKAASIPKTVSGKIQRGQCRNQYINNQLNIIYSDKKSKSLGLN
jgi:acyl-CoA synthetase (AMP-forming)/AMP-acid ligase II